MYNFFPHYTDGAKICNTKKYITHFQFTTFLSLSFDIFFRSSAGRFLFFLSLWPLFNFSFLFCGFSLICSAQRNSKIHRAQILITQLNFFFFRVRVNSFIDVFFKKTIERFAIFFFLFGFREPTDEHSKNSTNCLRFTDTFMLLRAPCVPRRSGFSFLISSFEWEKVNFNRRQISYSRLKYQCSSCYDPRCRQDFSPIKTRESKVKKRAINTRIWFNNFSFRLFLCFCLTRKLISSRALFH